MTKRRYSANEINYLSSDIKGAVSQYIKNLDTLNSKLSEMNKKAYDYYKAYNNKEITPPKKIEETDTHIKFMIYKASIDVSRPANAIVNAKATLSQLQNAFNELLKQESVIENLSEAIKEKVKKIEEETAGNSELRKLAIANMITAGGLYNSAEDAQNIAEGTNHSNIVDTDDIANGSITFEKQENGTYAIKKDGKIIGYTNGDAVNVYYKSLQTEDYKVDTDKYKSKNVNYKYEEDVIVEKDKRYNFAGMEETDKTRQTTFIIKENHPGFRGDYTPEDSLKWTKGEIAAGVIGVAEMGGVAMTGLAPAATAAETGATTAAETGATTAAETGATTAAETGATTAAETGATTATEQVEAAALKAKGGEIGSRGSNLLKLEKQMRNAKDEKKLFKIMTEYEDEIQKLASKGYDVKKSSTYEAAYQKLGHLPNKGAGGFSNPGFYK